MRKVGHSKTAASHTSPIVSLDARVCSLEFSPDGAHIAVGGENSQLHVYATEQLDSATKRQREKQRRNISSAPPVTMQMRSVFGDFVRDIKWISSIKGNNGCEV